jgi:hypothetical protein
MPHFFCLLQSYGFPRRQDAYQIVSAFPDRSYSSLKASIARARHIVCYTLSITFLRRCRSSDKSPHVTRVRPILILLTLLLHGYTVLFGFNAR